MQSAFHNLPTVNGVMQKNGRTFRAEGVSHRADRTRAVLDLDIAAAYPPEAGIVSWKRRIALERGKRVVVEEDYSLERAGLPIELSFMSWREPVAAGAGRIDLLHPDGGKGAGPLKLLYDGRAFEPGIETIEIKDERLRASWGGRIYRVVLRAKASAKSGKTSVRIE
jgi:hypothetical protein